ncbi:family 35 glycoside hydrolase [Cryphonectria parasitica EP155]|uniref:Beta-galactosidase n=1 Tax=Cryphonectria parasitica (strain ATCC 38755 / EP155) TaxID=660469 RepID=A0A9P5CQ18_CRYP1|nr:family 35 glycoside hydrolase [Cryphonectria parasitica EP155]KAF3766743.1 family 35 glycoside hydrolase [Cryphonectria parasitica EP155]
MLSLLLVAPVVLATATSSAAAPAFTYNSSSFLLHGDPYVIIGGQMDPQRIPPQYWQDRLAKARAMGLNTIFSYVYWNLLEPEQGLWKDDEDYNDIAQYFRIAQEEGLHVVLRPGPYICGEREWGGFPAWLSTVPGLVVRSFNEPYLNLSKTYLEHLGAILRPLQVTQGGPLLMVQVENEFGSYNDSDHEYTQALRDVLRENFDVPLYTNDGGTNWTLAGGEVPGALAETDGDPSSGFAARDEYVTDPSELGPLLDGEYYTYAPDTWGSDNPHSTTVGDPSEVAQFVELTTAHGRHKDLDYVLGANNSISLYMFHGGTNFAFSNGALWKNYTASFTTSYDYGAPLSEDGRTTDLYFTLRDTIQKYTADKIPEPPADIPLLSIPDITLSAKSSLFNVSSSKTSETSPLTMEQLGQSYGFILYEHQVIDRGTELSSMSTGIRTGVIDSTYAQPKDVSLNLGPGDTLQLLVENLGRVDYWSLESDLPNHVLDPYKGIVGNVTVGESVLETWSMVTIPLDEIPPMASPTNSSLLSQTPTFYSGTFTLGSNYTDSAQLDTFIAIPNGVKGMVWVNGFSLGRYWIVGPQQSLYLPGTVLNAGQSNEIVVLELEPGNSAMIARGEAERVWANYPDPDYS